MLEEHATVVTRTGTTVQIHGMQEGSYPEGVPPIEVLASPWNHYLANVQIVQGAVAAEHAGFDAVAVTCFHDPALAEARSTVGIPVVSMCESSLLAAFTMGQRLGLIGIGPANVRLVQERVRAHGFDSRVVGILPLADSVHEHDIEAAFVDEGRLAEAFRATARRVMAAGAEVLVPCETLLNTALARQGVCAVDGIPVLDGYSAMLAHAEMLVQLRRTRSAGLPAPAGAVSRATATLQRAAARSLAQEVLVDP